MIKLFIPFVLFIAVAISGCRGGHTSSASPLECTTYPVEGGYGYVILQHKDTVIKQPFIPAVKGHKAFLTSEDARKTGECVISKLLKGESPVIEIEELEKLWVKK